ncbi:MAG: hypothetical protein H6Q29_68 [Bacteroidetes bacterium]|nr:hypothetical protein [Bacteroidota bacterium]
MRFLVSPSVILLLALALPGRLEAQPSRPPVPLDSTRIEQMISDMRVKVLLTDEQVPKVRAILTETGAVLQRTRAAGQVDRQAARELMLAADEKIKATLDPAQRPAYDRYLEERRQMMRNRMRDQQEKPQ